MVADGLSIINADYSSTSFRVSRASIGAHNFLGNNIAYPAAGQDRRQLPAGDEGHGPARRDRSGRASACWARPASRSPARSSATASSTIWRREDELRRRLPPRTGTTSSRSGCSCCVRWFYFFVVTLLGLAALDLYDARRGSGRSRCSRPGILLFSVVYFVLVERAVTGFRGAAARGLLDLRPRLLAARAALEAVRAGRCAPDPATAPRSRTSLWRLLGVRIGRRVFDDGCSITERTLVTIGDDCTLNAGHDRPVPLAGGRRLQVRPHHDRLRAAPSGSAPSSTTA